MKFQLYLRFSIIDKIATTVTVCMLFSYILALYWVRCCLTSDSHRSAKVFFENSRFLKTEQELPVER
jgi:hypothetical protein